MTYRLGIIFILFYYKTITKKNRRHNWVVSLKKLKNNGPYNSIRPNGLPIGYNAWQWQLSFYVINNTNNHVTGTFLYGRWMCLREMVLPEYPLRLKRTYESRVKRFWFSDKTIVETFGALPTVHTRHVIWIFDFQRL